MKLKLCLSLVMLSVLTVVRPGYATWDAAGARGWWGYTGDRYGGEGAPSTIFLAGGTGKTDATRGAYGDEYGFVGVFAQGVAEHGVYLCPFQAQCANKRKSAKSWSTYYYPEGFDDWRCGWFCEDGWSGNECKDKNEAPGWCDDLNTNAGAGARYAGLGMKKWDSGNIEHLVASLDTWNDGGHPDERDVILAAIEYKSHGMIVAPVRVMCAHDNWKSVDSFVKQLFVVGVRKLMCAQGYKPNSAGTDCEQINTDMCAVQNMSFCSGFDRAKYSSDIHKLESGDGCVKYFCKEAGKAFPVAGDVSCVDCSTGVKGGANTTNGECVKCETGQYFDQKSNSCKQADAYTTTDLQYGKGQTKNSIQKDATSKTQPQCWMLATPAEYIYCVQHNGAVSATATTRPTGN